MSVTCVACRESAEWPVLVFTDVGGGYPRAWWRTRAALLHTGCDMGLGYSLENWWWRPGELDDWIRHLSTKRWFGARLVDVVRAHGQDCLQAYAQRLAAAGRIVPVQRDARDISPGVRSRVMARDHFRCRRCGCGPDVRILEVDHVTPVARGGGRAIANLQTLCWLCNAGKSASPPTAHDLTPGLRGL